MKFQVASDLHLEFLQRHFPGYRVIEPNPEADALILAGDIHSHTHALDAFAGWPVPVFYVHGNHEMYGAHYWGLLQQMHDKAAANGIHLLDDSEESLGEIRLLGGCLWTDYAFAGDPSMGMHLAQRNLNDHRLIRAGGNAPFRAADALSEHRKTRGWLSKKLAEPFEGKTVVVTHHGVHANSVHPRFQGSDLNGAFVSDLTRLVEKADVWIHGHVHNSAFYSVGKCRVVVNPRGYPLNLGLAGAVADIKWENPEFDASLLVEV
ncbi:hypothetical protein F6X40_23830 [Paraburkholderia sp. UCT31]|uniref:metallophosphoesterase n=1 Tax=Paraburkholderia sp. UCT31 TaxID=2615209 RepID=UPI001655C785|nr:metallophosphoesterase [Paraburkholderia sp. UCT31]MBC8739747.1 hypothetical protein [Paraburkholderia sp. UCT31]